MKKIFADSVYWIALINPKDQWRQRAGEVSRNFNELSIFTTDEILTETLNYFAESGEYLRGIVTREIEKILLNQDVERADATHENFLNGFELYKNRLDKGYSLTDCISMNIMREREISEILTHDPHFT
jgi:uncharacterized protein